MLKGSEDSCSINLDVVDARRLQTAPPLPTDPIYWTTGWKGVVPPDAELLDGRRREAINELFKSETSSPSELERCALNLQSYSKALVGLCRRGGERGLSHRRTQPLVFTWCFPSEKVDGEEVVVMRSAYIGYEWLCTNLAASILMARAAVQFHHGCDAVAGSRCFKAAVQLVSEMLHMLPTSRHHVAASDKTLLPLFNESQWARLRRQALPLQLQPEWNNMFRSALMHRYHLCCSMQHLAGGHSDKQVGGQILRGSEESALEVFRAARDILIYEPYLRGQQQLYAQVIYDESLAQLIKFRAQGFLADAELAVDQMQVGIARQLLQISQRGWWAFCEGQDASIMQELLQRKESLETILQAVPPTHTTEQEALEWRRQLPHLLFSI